MMPQNAGKYRLLQPLGQGASAQVYLGEHVYLKTRAAIKLLHQLSAFDKQEFVKEAQTIAKLHHQHIVNVLDFDFTDQDTPFLVMEYAEHGSLRQLHPRGTQLPLLTIVAYLQQIGEALMYVHQAGVIHADVKPENMLLGDNHRLLLGDFGIATLARQKTAQLICGTPAYMAPEQIQLHPCAASDQYALAIVTYEWLCGQLPFQGQDVLDQQRQAPVPSLRQFVPGLATEIEQIVRRALAKDPAARFPDVAAFVSAFEQAAFAPISIPTFTLLSPTANVATPTPAILPTQAAAASALAPLALPTQQAASTPTSANQPDAPVSGTAMTILRGNSAPVVPTPARPVARKLGELLYTLDLESGSVRTLGWSPDGSTLAAGCDYQLVFTWEALTGQGKREYQLHESQLRSLAWSPSGRTLASACADQLIHVWAPDQAKPQPLLTYRGHMGNFTLGLACVVAWSPSSLLLASAGTDQTAQVWRASNGDLVCTCRGHTNDINALAWSPDGTQLATGSDDGSVRLWNAGSGQILATFQHHHKQVYALAWSPDGTRLVSAGEGNSIYIWQVSETAQTRYTIYQGHARSVYALAWSPDSSQVASAGRDRTVQIWRADDGLHHYTYAQHQGSVLALAWSPDGALIASADEDGQAWVWQARN